MGKVLPSETAARESVAKLAYKKEEQIQGDIIFYKQIFLIVDEAEIAKRKYINVLVGSLDTVNDTFLIDCLPLESGSNVNSSIILHTVDDILRQLETKSVCIALDRCCSVHVFGWQNIKEIIPIFDACHLRCTLTT